MRHNGCLLIALVTTFFFGCGFTLVGTSIMNPSFAEVTTNPAISEDERIATQIIQTATSRYLTDPAEVETERADFNSTQDARRTLRATDGGTAEAEIVETYFATFTAMTSTATATPSPTRTRRPTSTRRPTITATPTPTLTPTVTAVAQTPTPAPICRLRVSVLNPVNLRVTPSTGAEVVEVLSANVEMDAYERVVASSGLAWYRVRLELNGELIEGYIRFDVVTELTPC